MIFIKSDDLCVALLPNMMKYCYGLWVLLSGSVVNIDTIYGHITFFLWIHMISCDHTWLILCNVLHHIFLWRMVFMLYDFLHQVKFSSYFFNASWGFRPWIAVLSGMDFAFMLLTFAILCILKFNLQYTTWRIAYEAMINQFFICLCKRDFKVCIYLKFGKHGKLVNSVFANNRMENFHFLICQRIFCCLFTIWLKACLNLRATFLSVIKYHGFAFSIFFASVTMYKSQSL